MKEISLTRGFTTTVNDERYDMLYKHKWHCNKQGYATRSIKLNEKYIKIKMHREIMGIIDPKIKVDHRNGNKMCNEDWNLRVCSTHQNNMNKELYCNIENKTSVYKGVSYDRKRNKWRAVIMYNYKQLWLGYHKDETLAAIAYNKKAKELFGEFANLNHIV